MSHADFLWERREFEVGKRPFRPAECIGDDQILCAAARLQKRRGHGPESEDTWDLASHVEQSPRR
jgi:hypothetical protein